MILAVLKAVLICTALVCGTHHGTPARAVKGTVHTVSHRRAAPYNPCAPGHAPVNPDAGHCQGTHYIPS